MSDLPKTFPLTDRYDDNASLAFGDYGIGSAPHAVVARALSLASGGELLLVDSHAALENDGSTWSVYGLLARALLHVQVKRPSDPAWSAHSSEGDETKDVVTAAWLRPLSTVTAVEAAHVNSNAKPRADGWFWAAGAVVRFSDGATLDLPAPRSRSFGNAVGVHPIAAAVRRHLLGQPVDPRT